MLPGPVALGYVGCQWCLDSTLSALDPYKGYFAAVTLAFIGTGFWQVYKKGPAACKDGSYCPTPVSGRVTKITLWVATVLVLAALTIDWWAPLFY